jgi:hypothetical protein
MELFGDFPARSERPDFDAGFLGEVFFGEAILGEVLRMIFGMIRIY